ncbi:hypothetical protein QT397_20720 [Microbulbifer sp. MKSA007]|uniref:hypothetical protein n=1 Tax=unclassified Microbulbifer TaxID=2619833 RepID=UPI002B2E1C2E|nr:hypothetical protein QT397_20720 [Microbulbifer sp. MKSA007]
MFTGKAAVNNAEQTAETIATPNQFPFNPGETAQSTYAMGIKLEAKRQTMNFQRYTLNFWSL